MKNVKWLLTVLFIFSICIPSFAGHVPLHGHLKKKQRSVNLDVPIKDRHRLKTFKSFCLWSF